MKIAVTGASGFLGRHILAELARRSIETIAVTRPGSGKRIQTPAMESVQLDVHNPPDNAYESMGRPDVLIHLAWGGLPNYRSLHHYETELPAQYRFLKNLVESGLPALVVSGTCFEYGMQSGPLGEDTESRPANPYGLAKDVLRRQLEFLKQEHPYCLAWARLFYLHGEGQADNSLYSQLVKAVSSGQTSFNMSGGEQLRDYLPVTDAARYLCGLALLNQDIGTINICSGKPVSVRGLVEDWIRQNDWSIRLNLGYYPYPDYEPMAFWGVADRLTLLLGETP